MLTPAVEPSSATDQSPIRYIFIFETIICLLNCKGTDYIDTPQAGSLICQTLTLYKSPTGLTVKIKPAMYFCLIK